MSEILTKVTKAEGVIAVLDCVYNGMSGCFYEYPSGEFNDDQFFYDWYIDESFWSDEVELVKFLDSYKKYCGDDDFWVGYEDGSPGCEGKDFFGKIDKKLWLSEDIYQKTFESAPSNLSPELREEIIQMRTEANLSIHIANYVLVGDLKGVERLLEEGADVNFSSVDAPLIHLAVGRGDIEMSILLLEAGANVEATQDYNNETPLMHASRVLDVEMVKLLLERGANVHVRSQSFDEHQTPLVTAFEYAEYKNVENSAEKAVEIGALLINHGSDSVVRSGRGWGKFAQESLLERSLKRVAEMEKKNLEGVIPEVQPSEKTKKQTKI